MTTNMNSIQNTSNLEQNTVEMIQSKLMIFLEEFEVNEEKFYLKEVNRMMMNKLSTLYIDLNHLSEFDMVVYTQIYQDFYKYEKHLKKVIYNFISKIEPAYIQNKHVYISFYNSLQTEDIRDLKTDKLGKLITFRGTLTKTTDVKPELVIGNFECKMCKENCGYKEQQFEFTRPKFCTKKNCQNKTQFKLIIERSIFGDWQKIKIQETSNDLPSGAVPRNLDVVLRGEQVDKAQPGDRVLITGCLIVVPEKSFLSKPGERNELTKQPESFKTRNRSNQQRETGSDLNFKLVFLANNIIVNKMKFSKDNQIDQYVKNDSEEEIKKSYMENLTESDKIEIQQMSSDPLVFNKLANMISPSILGNLTVKKGILMMLFGGVNKNTGDGMKIRGDLNICLVGDPSTAKSQFLKYIHNSIPRTVYTSGRGSSSAGLTASLSRDPETGDYTLEAGALMLADNGICCIDEFDKMMEKDQVAIHEAMEQQTISITKAGIQATLNARCSILAAMNPIMGRYDKTKNLKSNVKLSPPLMSRFDLFFILIDECRKNIDEMIAKRIVGLHKNYKEDILEHKEDRLFNQSSLLRYMKFARFMQPEISLDAKHMLKRVYLRLRSQEYSIHKTAYKFTVRQLESLIRLSEACAKIHLKDVVEVCHVTEAVKLLNESIIKIKQEDYILNFDQEEEIVEKKTLAITKEEYDTIKGELISIFNQTSKGQKIDIEALTLKLLSGKINLCKNVDDMHRIEKKIKSVIKNMIKKDKVFVVQVDENEEYLEYHPRARNIGKNK